MLQNIKIINLEVVFSDPMLSAGFALLIVGLIGFLFSLIKFLTYRSDDSEFAIPSSEYEAEPPTQENIPEPAPPETINEPAIDREKTVVISPEESEVRAGLDLALTSVSSLSRKMGDLEEKMKALERVMEFKLEPNELKELPSNPAEFGTKLLKLAEHVIILEREVAFFKKKKTSAPTGNSPDTPQEIVKEIPKAPPPIENPFEKTIVEKKPPIMPL